MQVSSITRHAAARLGTVGITLVASLALVAPASAAPSWLPFAPIGLDPQKVCHDFVIPGGGSYVCDARVAMSSDGTTYLAYVNFDGSAPAPGFRRVFLSIRPPGGTFSAPVALSPAGKNIMGANGTLISLASNARGDIILSWAYVEGSSGIVQTAYKSASATTPRVETLSNTADSANLPSVAIADDGSAIVAWRNTHAGTTTVQASFLSAGATNFGPFSDISDAGAIDAVQVVEAPSGDAIAGWVRGGVVEASRRPAGSTFGGRLGLSGANASSPDFAIAPSGRATVVWQRDPNTGVANDDIIESRERRVTPDFANGTWGSSGLVTQAGEAGFTPAVAVDPENTATAVWSSLISGERKVRAATRASGGSFSNHQPISAPGAQPFAPQIAVSPTGEAVATWALNDGASEAVQSSRAPKGGSFGGVDVLMQGTPGFTRGVYFRPQPTVAFDGQGNGFATWVGYTCEPNCNSLKTIVQYAGFDAAPPSIAAMNVPGSGTTGAGLDMNVAASDRMTATSISWAFGDGASATGSSVSHAYGTPGVYTVTAIATDAVGNASSATRLVQVTNPPPAVVVPASKPGAISITLGFAFSSSTKKQTKFTSMTVKGFPSGSTVTVTCIKGSCPSSLVTKKKKGKKTTTVSKPLVFKNAKGTVKLSKVISKALKAGTRIRVDVDEGRDDRRRQDPRGPQAQGAEGHDPVPAGRVDEAAERLLRVTVKVASRR